MRLLLTFSISAVRAKRYTYFSIDTETWQKDRNFGVKHKALIAFMHCYPQAFLRSDCVLLYNDAKDLCGGETYSFAIFGGAVALRELQMCMALCGGIVPTYFDVVGIFLSAVDIILNGVRIFLFAVVIFLMEVPIFLFAVGLIVNVVRIFLNEVSIFLTAVEIFLTAV